MADRSAAACRSRRSRPASPPKPSSPKSPHLPNPTGYGESDAPAAGGIALQVAYVAVLKDTGVAASTLASAARSPPAISQSIRGCSDQQRRQRLTVSNLAESVAVVGNNLLVVAGQYWYEVRP